MSSDTAQQCDLSVVITVHEEGLLAHRTLRSIQAAQAEAEAQGLRSELIVVLDKPNEETRDYFARWKDKAIVVEVSHDDAGRSRNAGVAQARGKYVALVDAKDLVGKDWLHLAYQRAEQSSLSDFVVHAEYTISFEGRPAYAHHFPSDAAGFDRADLLTGCPWHTQLFAPRSTLERIPFASIESNSGFGHPCWHWICNLLAAGGEVLIAPGTCNFMRSPAESSSVSAQTLLIPPSKLFNPRILGPQLSAGSDANGAAGSRHAVPSGVDLWKQRVKAFPRYLSRVTESYPPLQKTLGAVYRKVVPKPDLLAQFPDWLLTQWRAIAEIEPALFPDQELLGQMEREVSRDELSTAAFETICQELGTNHTDIAGPMFTHIYLVPRLKRGGTDRVTINFILLTASNPANRALVIATDEPDSPWKVRLPDCVRFLNFCQISSQLDRQQKKNLLARLLVQLQPQVIHNIYSILGNQVYTLYGQAISRLSRLYAPAYCVEIEPDGKPVGEIISFLPGHAQHLTAVMSDNQYILDYLAETFALDPAKLFVHYQPVVMKPLPPSRQRQPGEQLKVLWAGRLDRQKHPELMIEIARRCQADNIHFHVYGSPVVAKDVAKVDFSNSPNVTYHGEFDGLSSLPLHEYHVFLNTSQWEGMPNILLEAVGEGLPILASDVGGVNELVIQDETGMLVSPYDNIDGYVSELRRLLAHPELGERFIEASRKLLAERHSWEHFAAELSRLPGYLENPCLLEKAELSRLEMPISSAKN